MTVTRLTLTLLLSLCLVGAWVGCGGKYDKPLEVYKEMPTGAYNYADSLTGFTSASCMSMTGGNIFVSLGTGEVGRYYNNGAQVADVVYARLDYSTSVGTSLNAVAVADSSDSLTVKVYSTEGGDPMVVIHDPEWQRIGGLAVDDDGNIYVSDAVRNFVRSYDSEGNRRFEVDLADSGFGIGHVLTPRGLFFDGEALLIAEGNGEKAQVQRIAIDQPQTGIPFSAEVFFISTFTDDDGNDIDLVRPVAVAVDGQGRILVLDQVLGKIFRYTEDGYSDAIVNDPEDEGGGPDVLGGATSIGTHFNIRSLRENVYCLETNTGLIHRWEEAEKQAEEEGL
jgi:hypothetical protein